MGIFDAEVDAYEIFEAKIKFRNWMIGGQPKNPKALREMYLRRGGADAEQMLRRELLRVAAEMEIPVTANLSLDALEALVDELSTQTGNGFLSDERGLYFGTYQVKAAFRENASIIFPYPQARWGATKKNAKAYLAERLFVLGPPEFPDRIYLGRKEPDGVLIKPGTVGGKSGKRSIVTRAEYVNEAEPSFLVKIRRDATDILGHVREIWVSMQDGGLGAMRSSGFGTFDIIGWASASVGKQVRRARPSKIDVSMNGGAAAN